MDNPLLLPILERLKHKSAGKNRESWKVNQLMTSLQEANLLPELDSKKDKNLFKKNFLIMNALYMLQEYLEREGYLQVEAMDIRFFSRTCKKCKPIDKVDPLRDYYLNWNNYDTSAEEIKLLLDSFWNRYSIYLGKESGKMSRKDALKTFQLPYEATQSEIRRAWKQQALKWHPDREEGDKDKFGIYYQAWSVLRH